VNWDPTALPDQSGRTILITGSNAGLGYFSSEQLARAGAHVVMSGRNEERLAAALAAVRRRVPGASVESLVLDTADRASVRAAAERMRERGSLEGIMMNAGTVHPPQHRTQSADGDELVLATNVLGHFVLGAELLPVLERSPHARIVWLGSMITRLRDSDLTDLQLRRGYNRWIGYAQSKLVSQIVGFELDRRLRAAGSPVSSLVAHPGFSISGRTRTIRGVNEPTRRKRFVDNLQALFAQSKEVGAQAQVRAMTDPLARGSEYIGPRFIAVGRPVPQRPTNRSTDAALAARVWSELESITGASWPIASPGEPRS
jgi:NAD(P)-dependent dehydrogenase (short-subunit alcohol dehydrogenase family)